MTAITKDLDRTQSSSHPDSPNLGASLDTVLEAIKCLQQETQKNFQVTFQRMDSLGERVESLEQKITKLESFSEVDFIFSFILGKNSEEMVLFIYNNKERAYKIINFLNTNLSDSHFLKLIIDLVVFGLEKNDITFAEEIFENWKKKIEIIHLFWLSPGSSRSKIIGFFCQRLSDYDCNKLFSEIIEQAIQKNDIATVRLVLEAGNKKMNFSNFRPLITVSCVEKTKNLEIFKLFLQYHPNTNIKYNKGFYLLHYLCDSRNLEEFIQALLSHGVEVNRPTSEDRALSALYIAAYHSDYDYVRMLLAANADPLQPNEDGSTPLSIVLKRNNQEIVNLFKFFNIIKDEPKPADPKPAEKVEEKKTPPERLSFISRLLKKEIPKANLDLESEEVETKDENL